ncbi:MAG TPA: ATP-binding protein, partial [Actinoplanes sp.]|nr:ATP-binding protein [Actinoplanes sp.]
MNRRTRLIGAGLLAVFWAAAAVPAVTDAVQALAGRIVADRLGRPVDEVVLALEAERRLSVTARPDAELTAQRAQTDEAAGRLRQPDRAGWQWLATSEADRTAGELLARLDGLPALREAVDTGRTDRRAAVTAYAAMIGSTGDPDPTADGIRTLTRSREILAEEDALLAAVSAGSGPARADRIRLAQLAGARRALFSTAGVTLSGDAAGRHRELADGPVLARLAVLEDTFATQPGGIADPADWAPVFNEVNTALWDLRNNAAQAAADAATSRAVTATVWAGTVGGVGFVVLLGLLVVTLRRRSAESATAPGTPVRSAGPAATGARSGPEELLWDLDRRNQVLLKRQRRLLDGLSRRAADEENAADLRRAADLASRLRRNVEKGVTLTGGVPDRSWQRLVPIDEIVREAAAEIADRERVVPGALTPAYLAGTAATDVVHLLAELAENAATFAPADSPVVVAGQYESDGYVLTVTDAGPGMTDDDLDTGHQTMTTAEPP